MAEEGKSHDKSKNFQGSSISYDSEVNDVLDKSLCSNHPKEKAYFNEIMGNKRFKTKLRYKDSNDGREGTRQESEHDHVPPRGVKRPPQQKRGRKVAPCGVCSRLMRSDKLKQHLLSHARPKGRDSRGRFSGQGLVAPRGGSPSGE